MKNRERQWKFLAGLCLGLITLCLYLPVWHYSFIEYDDQQYVTENPQVQAGLTWNGLVWAFQFHADNWFPLTWLSHMIDCQIYGANAGGHHLTNVLLHVANTLLLFLLLHRTTGAVWRSATVAALFAWHPLHVESVAWVAERKDVLCAFFWMLTLHAYVSYAAKASHIRFFSTLAMFALCLMSKPMAVTLPLVLLLLDYWPLNRIAGLQSNKSANLPIPFPQKNWQQLILEKIPFLTITTLGCWVTIYAQQHAIVSTAGLPISERVSHVLTAYFHYICTMLVPFHLAVFYPYVINLSATTIILCCLALMAITLFVLKNWWKLPYLTLGWLWYLGTLIPVIGLVQVGDQAWADRYTYLPLIGLFVCIVWGVAEIARQPYVLATAATLVLVTLLALTSVQLSYWKNTQTLFTHAAVVIPENYMAITMVGSELAKAGRLNEAMIDYRLALNYKPSFPEAHFYLGNAYEQEGQLDEAVNEYEQALPLKAIREQTHIFLGMVLTRQGKYDEAISHYESALKLNPDSAVAENNLARLYHSRGQFDEAIEHYTAALQINPELALAHNNLGILLLQKNDLIEGTSQLRKALQLNPTNTETQLNLALALNQQNQWPEAADLFAQAVHVNSEAKIHYQYAIALAHTGKTREAMSHYADALLIQPDFPDALDGLAWILATTANPKYRNGAEAVKMAERACELTAENDSEKLKTLAAAQAEAGDFSTAVITLKTAETLASGKDKTELLQQYQQMQAQFQKSEPWREP